MKVLEPAERDRLIALFLAGLNVDLTLLRIAIGDLKQECDRLKEEKRNPSLRSTF